MQQHSLAWILSIDVLFPGVGKYHSSEILHRLHSLWNISPWSCPNQQELNVHTPSEVNYILLMMGTLLEFHQQMKRYSKYFNPSTHDHQRVKDFYFHFLQVYRKDNAKLWNFNQGSIYTFVSDSPSEKKIIRFEEWNQSTETATLRESGLGVGPLWWHSVNDFPKLPSKTTSDAVTSTSPILQQKMELHLEQEQELQQEQEVQQQPKKRYKVNPNKRKAKSFKPRVEIHIQRLLEYLKSDPIHIHATIAN